MHCSRKQRWLPVQITSEPSDQECFVVQQVLLYLICASWLAQRVLRSDSDAARTVVQGLLRHVVQPIIQVPLQLLGLPNLASEIVESFLAESIEARKSQETASMHTLPLVIAAFNLHRRLRQILDESHAYNQRKSAGAASEGPNRQTSHSKAKYELLFLFGEYLAWQEELRRFVHRSSDPRYMQEARMVSDAFSEPLVCDSDPVLDKEIRAVGGKVDPSSTVDAASCQQDYSRTNSLVAWDKVTQFFRRAAVGLNARDTQGCMESGQGESSTGSGGDEWIEFWLAGVDPSLGQLPIVYRSRAEAVNRQHDTNAGLVKQLERNDVVYIWRGLLANGAAMKFVRDTDCLKREADGTLICDGGLPIEVDPITGMHQPAPVFWLAAGASTSATRSGNVCKFSPARPGAKAAGTIAAAVATVDGAEQASSNCIDVANKQCSNATSSSSTAIGPSPAPSTSPSSVDNILRDDLTQEKSCFAGVVSNAEEAEEVELRQRMKERRHRLATLGEHAGGSVRALVPSASSSEEEGKNDMQTDGYEADCTAVNHEAEVVYGEDCRLSPLELRMSTVARHLLDFRLLSLASN